MNSLGSFRSKSGEERLRKRRLQRWMLLLGALGILSLSALLLTSTNIRAPVYMNPCDLFGGKVCIDSLFQPPTPPPRALTDEELAMRVLAKDLLLDRTTPSKQKPKIAFMFLTAGPLPFEALWEKFFEVSFAQHSACCACRCVCRKSVCVCVFDDVHSCTRMIVFSSEMALRNVATKFLLPVSLIR